MPINENTLLYSFISNNREIKEIRLPQIDIHREIGFPENKNIVKMRIIVTEKAIFIPYKCAARSIIMFDMPSFTPGIGINTCSGKKLSNIPHKAAITE